MILIKYGFSAFTAVIIFLISSSTPMCASQYTYSTILPPGWSPSRGRERSSPATPAIVRSPPWPSSRDLSGPGTSCAIPSSRTGLPRSRVPSRSPSRPAIHRVSSSSTTGNWSPKIRPGSASGSCRVRMKGQGRSDVACSIRGPRKALARGMVS